MAHRLSSEAEAELDEIWYYVAQGSGSIELADRFVDLLTRRFYLLAVHPYLGRKRDQDLLAGMRSFVVGEYLILYRIEQADVLILHVVRGSRNIEGLFGR